KGYGIGEREPLQVRGFRWRDSLVGQVVLESDFRQPAQAPLRNGALHRVQILPLEFRDTSLEVSSIESVGRSATRLQPQRKLQLLLGNQRAVPRQLGGDAVFNAAAACLDLARIIGA